MAKFAFVFPGQGTQYVGMGQDVYDEFETVRETFDEAKNILGIDIAALCFAGPQAALDLTVNTQIAVLTLDIALYRIFRQSVQITPVVMAGHSLGEYAALYASGAIALAELLPLVQARAEYHQRAVSLGVGAMAAIIGLSGETVEDLCCQARSENEGVSLAIRNAPNQVVISGHTAAVEKIIAESEKKGALKVVKLPISVPCHCSLLDQAAEWLRADLNGITFHEFEIPVIPNCDASLLYTRDNVRELLARQITSPLQWQGAVEKMSEMGVDRVIEIGPRRTLSGLIKRIDRTMRLHNVEDAASLKKTAATLNA